MFQIQKWLLQKLNIIISVALFFGAILVGFLVGSRMKEIEIRDKFYVVDKNSKFGTGTENADKTNTETVKIEAKAVDGVKFIKPNEKKECGENYSIKGTFNADNGNYYTKTNKSYDRIKPDICFATEDFAQGVAGFIKKF
jgi:hypothetical protein